MVVNTGLRDQCDEVGRSRDDDKCPAAFLDKDDVKHKDGHGEYQLDAFVDQQPCQLVGMGVHVFLHQVAIEGTQNHEEVGSCDHPVVPPWFVGAEAEQHAVHDEADEQEDRKILCQWVVFQSSAQMVSWLSWFSVKPPLMANS